MLIVTRNSYNRQVVSLKSGGVPPSSIVAPVISGTAIVGQTLSSTTGTWLGTLPITYSYQWKRGVTNVGTTVLIVCIFRILIDQDKAIQDQDYVSWNHPNCKIVSS